MTEAETLLWSCLRSRKRWTKPFRRQHAIDPYIADFACVQARLVVEVDGATHSSDEEIAYDRRRDAYMRERGWRIVRVTNDDVYRRLDDVLDWIARSIPIEG